MYNRRYATQYCIGVMKLVKRLENPIQAGAFSLSFIHLLISEYLECNVAWKLPHVGERPQCECLCSSVCELLNLEFYDFVI